RYMPMFKAVTATPEGAKLDVFKLQRAMFLVKVTSAPAGATVTVAGKPVGVTPTTIKLPAFEASRVTMTKDGYATDTEPFTPKANNAAFHVVLKRGALKRH